MENDCKMGSFDGTLLQILPIELQLLLINSKSKQTIRLYWRKEIILINVTCLADCEINGNNGKQNFAQRRDEVIQQNLTHSLFTHLPQCFDCIYF